MDQDMRLRIGQNAQSWMYPGLSTAELSSDPELLTNYRRTKGYNRVLIALSSALAIHFLWRGLR